MTSPRFIPTELIDNIIDEVAQDTDPISQRQTLASIALGSWALRHRAHGHLFAHIDIRGTSAHLHSATPRIRLLLQILNTDHWSGMNGVSTYIKSISIYMTGPTTMVRPTLDDGTLANIFRKIVKSGELSGSPRSLSLTLGVAGQPGLTFDWTSFNVDFLDAFYTLCRNPSFTTLHLSRFTNVPRDIFRNSTLQNISLSEIRLVGETLRIEDLHVPTAMSDVAVDKHKNEPPLQEGGVIRLESLDIDHSFVLLNILDLTPDQSNGPDVVFSCLKKLRVQIHHVAHYEKTARILQGAVSSLNDLELNLRYREDGKSAGPLDLHKLSHLKYLSISHVSTSYKNPGWSCMQQICNLLHQPYLPPSLQKITLKMLLYSRKSDKSPLDIVRGYPYALLDDLFSHPRFDTLQHVVLIFNFNSYLCRQDQYDEHEFQEKASAYVRNVFPEVNSRSKFRFDVIIVPNFIHYSAMSK